MRKDRLFLHVVRAEGLGRNRKRSRWYSAARPWMKRTVSHQGQSSQRNSRLGLCRLFRELYWKQSSAAVSSVGKTIRIPRRESGDREHALTVEQEVREFAETDLERERGAPEKMAGRWAACARTRVKVELRTGSGITALRGPRRSDCSMACRMRPATSATWMHDIHCRPLPNRPPRPARKTGEINFIAPP